MREKIISDALRRLAAGPVQAGSTITRAEAIAHRLWQLALGDREIPPCSWAMKLLFERLEGKPGVADSVGSSGDDPVVTEITAMAKDRAREMANGLADDVIAGRIKPRA